MSSWRWVFDYLIILLDGLLIIVFINFLFQICGTLKEVSAPVKVVKHERRRRIPVEMSGGGV
jgi:hypothetical protein